MAFNYSNHKLWSAISAVCVIIGVIFLFLAIIAIRYIFFAFIFLAVFIACGYTIYHLQYLHNKVYLCFEDKQLKIYSIFKNRPSVVEITAIKRVIKQNDLLVIQSGYNKTIRIYLNYFNAQDIRRLIMYLKFTPLIKSKFV